jgi:hypothetical protein
MASMFRSGKPKEPERREEPARELSAEEQLLAEKARAAAAKREAERRAQTGDVSDFLDDILAPVTAEAQAGPAEPPAPAVDRLLANEPGGPEPPTPPTPFEAEQAGSEAGAAEAAPAAGSEKEAGDRKIQAAEANRRALSATLASSWAGIMALGRSGEDVQRPAFEPEIVAGIFDRTVELLAVRRRRPRELEFEPEVAADAEGSPAAQRTAILSPGALPSDAQPAAGPRPGGVGSEPAYSLDDLPALPAEGAAAGDEPADRPPEAEPALQEDDLDDHALREALAAAEGASRKAEAAPPMQATPVSGEQAAGGAAREAPSPAPPAPTSMPDKQYSLEDLPQAPSGTERSSPSDGTGGVDRSRRTDDDRLGEEALPELPPGAAAAGASPGPGPLVTLERAVERTVEPGKSDAGVARGGSASGAPPVAAENAADLSVQQLAEMEHYIENQVDTVVAPRSALDATPPGGRLSLSGLVAKAGKAVRRLTVHALHALDRWLDPYCLSGKRLLGIVGILLWAGLIAYVLKVWVMGAHGE